MATPSMPQIPIQGMQCDPHRLAAAVVARLQVSLAQQPQPQLQTQTQPPPQARILDRGPYATLYLLSTSLVHLSNSVVVRVSTRPVYNTAARTQEKDKIRGYVGILLLIHTRAPFSVRALTPRILAYDASDTCEFGHGWIAMTRLPGRPLSESWPELSAAQREVVLRQLATFTNHLSSVTTSEHGDGDEDDQAGTHSWSTIGSLLARGDCQSFSLSEPTNDQMPPLDLEAVPLLLPKRHGANNLRPLTPKAQLTMTSSSLLILDDEDDDDDYLSCYEVLLPTPSPPSSPHRTQFFPASSPETEIPTSAVVKSCEDWLAGVKSGVPEIVVIQVEGSSTEVLNVASIRGEADMGDIYASLALWDHPSPSDPAEETPYSTPMSTILQLDEEVDEGIFAVSFASTPALSPVSVQMRRPPPPSLSLSTSNHMPTGPETSPRSASTNAVQITCPPATYLPSTTLEMFHTALDAELAFLGEHQPAAARCYNNNMVRLTQCGMADEVPRGARPAVCQWEGYSAQLKALKGVVREVVTAHEHQRDDLLVLGRVGWDAADILVQVEEDEDGDEHVRVTGVVDWEFAGVVPQWMVTGLPDFLRSSSLSTDDVEQQEGDGTLPLWEEASSSWALPPPISNNGRLVSVWRDTLDMDEEEDQWENNELVRAAWKVANVEWHEIQRGCAWARGYLTSHSHHHHHHHHSHSSTCIACQFDTQSTHYLAVEVPSDGECSCGGRSRGTTDTNETVESTMPVTPIEDGVPLPTAAAPVKDGQGLSFAGVFLGGGYSDEDSDEEEDSDQEESDEEEGEGEEGEEEYESASDSHDWRDEFESAFMFPVPRPSTTPHTSSTLLQPTASRVAQETQKKMAEQRKREKQKFEQGMNDPIPRVGYEVLWEQPPAPTKDDLDFLVERDLDAGW